MRRCPDPLRGKRGTRLRQRHVGGGEDGFTLVEVMVAFLIIAIIAVAGTSLTIRGLRATLEAKQLSQAKNRVNEQVEKLRGLPFFVAFTTSNAKVDVLDNYYPNMTAPALAPNCSADATSWISNKTAWTGYVAAGGARCAFEPPADAFYRTVVDSSVSGSTPTAVVVSTQFLGLASGKGSAALVLPPATGYAWNATGQDAPAASQIAGFVTAVFGPTGGTVKYSTSRTDIADRRGGPPLVSAETNAAALSVEATMSTGETRRLELGTVAGNGDVTAITKAAVEAVGGSMQNDTARIDGAAQLANSPGGVPSGNLYAVAKSSGGLSVEDSQTAGIDATSTVSAPGFGAPIAVASAAGGTFAVDKIRDELGLTASTPIVALDSGANPSMPSTGNCPAASPTQRAAGAGWMNTGTASPKTLDACARSAVSTVELFQTPEAPDGLIQVEVSDVIARCEINGATPTAATSGVVKVSWLTPSSIFESTTFKLSGTTVTTVSGLGLPAPTTALKGGKMIGDYIGSWAAFSGVATTADPDSDPDPAVNVRVAEARVPAAFTLATVGLRLGDGTPDPDTAVKVTIGRALCSATDRRTP